MNNRNKASKAVAWIDGLSTTNEKQAKGRLGNSEVGYCCLGLGCEVLGVDYDMTRGFSTEFNDVVGLNSQYGRYILTNGERAREGTKGKEELIFLNDHRNFTFKQIAERLKTHPRRYFHEAVGKLIAKHYRDAA